MLTLRKVSTCSCGLLNCSFCYVWLVDWPLLAPILEVQELYEVRSSNYATKKLMMLCDLQSTTTVCLWYYEMDMIFNMFVVMSLMVSYSSSVGFNIFNLLPC